MIPVRTLFIFICATLSTASFAQLDGVLDPTFGTGGHTLIPFGNQRDLGLSVALQPDGKIVVASVAGDFGAFGFALTRLHPDGNIDSSFGVNGRMDTKFGSGDEWCQTVIVQDDGKLLVTGRSHNDISSDFALARYLPDGTPDSTFDFDGKVTTDFAGYFDAAAMPAIQPDGKIVVCGITQFGNDWGFGLARYDNDGSLDYTFNNTGLVVTDFGPANYEWLVCTGCIAPPVPGHQ